MCLFSITSVQCYAIVPHLAKDLVLEHIQSLSGTLGFVLRDEGGGTIDSSWQFKTKEELKKILNERMKIYVRATNIHALVKRDQVIERVKKGLREDFSITDIGKMPKYSFWYHFLKMTGPLINLVHQMREHTLIHQCYSEEVRLGAGPFL
jgi:hypothetical protein